MLRLKRFSGTSSKRVILPVVNLSEKSHFDLSNTCIASNGTIKSPAAPWKRGSLDKRKMKSNKYKYKLIFHKNIVYFFI